MGGPNYAQFGDRVYAGGADVRAEAGYADGAYDLVVGCARVEERNEPGRAVSSTNMAIGAETGGHGTSGGKATDGSDEE
jgi:hypothetical protein